MKWILRIVGVLVVLLLVVGVVGYFALNSIVKTAVETAGSSATGVETRLPVVQLSPFGGTLELGGFNLAQPEGFTAGEIFRFDDADLEVAMGSLMSDTIQVPKVHLDGVHVTVAFENGKLNIQQLLQQIQENTGSSETSDEPDAPAEDDAAGKSVVIDSLRITNTTVTGAIGLIPGQDPISIDLKIANIEKTGIGSDGTGVKLEDAVGLILETIMLNVTEGIAADVPGLADLENVIGDAGQKATEALDQAGDQATRAIDDAGKKLEEGLGGLFGGKKDDAAGE